MGLHRAGRQEVGPVTGTQERGSFCRELRTGQEPNGAGPTLKVKENSHPQVPEFLELWYLSGGSKVIDT